MRLGFGYGLTITRRRNAVPLRVAQYMGYISTNILAASSSRRALERLTPPFIHPTPRAAPPGGFFVP